MSRISTSRATSPRCNPFIGYFIKDNECIGIKLGYSHLSANLDNLSIDIDEDMQFNLSDMRYLGETFSASIFHRAYIGIDRNKRFGFFNETELAFSSGSNRFRAKVPTKTCATPKRPLRKSNWG